MNSGWSVRHIKKYWYVWWYVCTHMSVRSWMMTSIANSPQPTSRIKAQMQDCTCWEMWNLDKKHATLKLTDEDVKGHSFWMFCFFKFANFIRTWKHFLHDYVFVAGFRIAFFHWWVPIDVLADGVPSPTLYTDSIDVPHVNFGFEDHPSWPPAIHTVAMCLLPVRTILFVNLHHQWRSFGQSTTPATL